MICVRLAPIFHWVVVHEFERHGWQVIDVYLGNPMRHDEKYLLINQGFAGKQHTTYGGSTQGLVSILTYT